MNQTIKWHFYIGLALLLVACSSSASDASVDEAPEGPALVMFYTEG